ncbi:MAG: flavin reductase [Planctomycetes bacterium]|nr:flavin reductase [Planctomycetota bacterium]
MLREISMEELRINPFDILGGRWMLLTAGDFDSGKFNSMTVGWGAFGTMWARPLAMIVVRPTRHTFDFTEEYDSFTLCSFPDANKEALKYMGAVSGRDEDKVAGSGLTPVKSRAVAAPSYAEAELVVECKKNYGDTMKPEGFMAPYIAKMYNNDYHKIYFGEVVSVRVTESYI